MPRHRLEQRQAHGPSRLVVHHCVTVHLLPQLLRPLIALELVIQRVQQLAQFILPIGETLGQKGDDALGALDNLLGFRRRDIPGVRHPFHGVAHPGRFRARPLQHIK
ncbi:MAG TPA: hypothetical protein VHV83_12755 [Armatimonadota bacterium]|nr:hypothetical protein [Armatimonadota bacterium]